MGSNFPTDIEEILEKEFAMLVPNSVLTGPEIVAIKNSFPQKEEKKFDWYYSHCNHCGYEFKSEHYYEVHPKYCPDCRHSKDWVNGRTANCEKCDLYKFACHEPMKGQSPKYQKTCCYFKELSK